MAHWPLLPLAFKKTEAADPGACLYKLLDKQDREGAREYAEPLRQLTEKRKAAAGAPGAALSTDVVDRQLLPYYVALRYAGACLPFDQAPGLHFSWDDTLSHRTHRARISAAEADLVSVLFNAAAVHSQLAAARDRSTPEGAKAAMQDLSAAAGYIAEAEQLALELPAQATLDMSLPGLAFVKSLLVAQAHMCGYIWMTHKGAHKVLTPVAAQGAELFQHAHQLQGGLPDAHPKWGLYCAASARLMDACAYEHAARHAHANNEADGDCGLAVGRARAAGHLLAQAAGLMKQKGHGIPGDFDAALKQQMAAVQQLDKKVTEDNEKCYHEKVPGLEDPKLPVAKSPAPLGPAQPAKAKTLAELSEKTGVPNAFAAMVPLEVREKAKEYKARVQSGVDNQCQASSAQAEAMRGRFNELGVMGLLATGAAAGGDKKLPQALRERIARIQAEAGDAGPMGRLQEITDMLGSLRKACGEKLDLCAAQLSAEAAADKQMREKYGARWTRTPSEGLADYRECAQQLSDYKGSMAQAANGDEQVAQRMREKQESLRRLDTPVHDLDSWVAGKAGCTPQQHRDGYAASVADLGCKMQRWEALQKEQEDMLAELRGQVQKDNIAQRLVQATPSEHDKVLADSEASYASRVQAAGEMGAQLARLVADIDSAVSAIRSVQEAGVYAAGEREKAINSLDQACTDYTGLRDNVQGGKAFYQGMVEAAENLHNKVVSYSAARALDLEDRRAEAEDEQRRAQQQQQDAEEARRVLEQMRAAAPAAAVRFATVTGAGSIVRRGEDLQSPQVAPDPLPPGTLVHVAEHRGRRARIVHPLQGWVSMNAADGTPLVQYNDDPAAQRYASRRGGRPMQSPAAPAWAPGVAPPAGVAQQPQPFWQPYGQPYGQPQAYGQPHGQPPAQPYGQPGAGYGAPPPQRGGYGAPAGVPVSMPVQTPPAQAAATWACHRCTYVNSERDNPRACEICQTPRAGH